MRMETSQKVMDGLHARMANRLPSSGEMAGAKGTAKKRFEQMDVGLAIALVTPSC
jgi:hypothetical protein